ncbi:MAG: PepSY domain-containing protein [Oscillospiraceae bacterium]|nr:PepSY domain-containing protein [Oscillospiraceae bacterium]
MINRKIKYAALLTALTVFTSGCGADNSDSQSSDNGAAENARTIILDDAKAAALNHAGLSENDVVFIKAKLEHDDGAAEYDIEFTADNFKYEYEIDAIDGKVLEFSSEAISEVTNNIETSSDEASVQITLDEAKNIALKHAGIKSSDAVFTKAKSDNDGGILKYDIEFTANNTEYEYEISAIDGDILESSAETVKTVTSAPAATAASSQITLDEAKKIALKHAGIKSSDAVFTKAKSDNDDGVLKYDIEFTANNTEYEYEISASDGSILESSVEAVRTVASARTEASSQLTLDEAKKIALKHAGIKSSDAVFTKAKSDNDDGVLKYDIEFTANNTEYEYEISASDGSILESSVEAVRTVASALTEASSQITLDEAKDIALKHAGFTSSQVKFTKAQLDYDNGVAEYEIEFRVNGHEYEYKINAETGKIIEYEIDD